MIINLQRRLAEIGRIRIGQQIPIGKTGKTRPTKLNTFRLTSPDKTRIRAAAQLYGGTPNEWQAPAGPQWEVITETTTLPIMVPPTEMAFSQYYELWSGGGCQRRCDGANETISDGPCLCDPDNRECAVHTRLSVMLRDLAGIGLWRIDTQGWNAALELQGAVELLQMAAGHGTMLPAQLRLEQRMQKRPNQQTRRFAVPVLDIEISPAQLLGGGSTELPPAQQYSDGTAVEYISAQINGSARLTPVPDTVQEHPAGTIAEQIKPPPPPKRRGQIPIPATGIKPRTATQIQAEINAETMTSDIIAQLPLEEPLDDESEIESITEAQLTKLAAVLRESGYDTHDKRHKFVTEAIGHPYNHPSELTKSEATDIITSLSADEDNE